MFAMEVSRLETNKEIGALHKMGEAHQPLHVFSIDHECLKKYGEEHGKFCLASLLEKREDEDHERFIGYNGLYRYGSHRIQFQFDASTGFWRRIPGESHRAYGNDADEEEDPLNVLFEDLNQSQCLLPSLSLDQQIQLIIKRLDQHFSRQSARKSDQALERNLSTRSDTFKEENEMKDFHDELSDMSIYERSKSLAIPEDVDDPSHEPVHDKDLVDSSFHSLVHGSRSKYPCLAPPVAPRRSRQNSACSTQSSVRYASFLPPAPMVPARRRRVVESISLRIRRKKKPFEKLVDLFSQTRTPTIYDLGLEFLRLYDGKFNYREGHTFVMPFRKKTWFLTIEHIKCVDCQLGDKEPRSVLLLKYKEQCTTVHV